MIPQFKNFKKIYITIPYNFIDVLYDFDLTISLLCQSWQIKDESCKKSYFNVWYIMCDALEKCYSIEN